MKEIKLTFYAPAERMPEEEKTLLLITGKGVVLGWVYDELFKGYYCSNSINDVIMWAYAPQREDLSDE